ncbi:hypothetical protein J11TS1_14210 [Oceanobacillus sp. J11TS1]|nr:hypothetical protein J11TS1_14210 [Oceanobacillus sp. J11TS1]
MPLPFCRLNNKTNKKRLNHIDPALICINLMQLVNLISSFINAPYS